jgi:hypothetical protein
MLPTMEIFLAFLPLTLVRKKNIEGDRMQNLITLCLTWGANSLRSQKNICKIN